MADATTPTPVNSAPKDWLLILTYVFPIVLIYTMIKKGKEGNYLAHCKNAAGAIAIYLVIQIVYQVLAFVVSIPLVFTILQLANLVVLLAMLYGAWQASLGKLPNLPVITQIGQKIPLEKWFNKTEATAQSAAAPVSAPAASPAPTPMPAPEPTPAPMPEPVAPAPTPAPTEPTPPTPPAPTTQA